MDNNILIDNMVRSDILNLVYRIKKCHSKSMYNKLLTELIQLYNLANTLQLDNILDVDNYAFKYFPFKEKQIEKKQKNFYIENHEFNSELVDNYNGLINGSIDNDFRYDILRMNYKESQNLVAEFLEKLDKNIFNVFKECVTNNRFIYLESNETDIMNAGLTFAGNYFKPYVLIEDYDSIFTAVTSVHETGHIYDFSNSIPNKYNYVEEIYSHFLELVFCDYLSNDKINIKNIKYSFVEDLEENIKELESLLQENIVSNLDFRQNYTRIYSIIEYTYGMILALEFYDIYLQDKELGMYEINDFSKTKNDFNTPLDVMKKYGIDKEEVLKGKVLEKYIKKI